MSLWGYVGHLAKTLIFGIGSNSLDVSTDVLNGKQFLETKIVNRTFEENSTIPEFCLPMNISDNYACEEYENSTIQDFCLSLNISDNFACEEYENSTIPDFCLSLNISDNFACEDYENRAIPDFCLPLNISNMYACEESDPVWGILSLACIQMPAIVMSLCGSVGLMTYYFKFDHSWKILWQILGVFSMSLFPYPLLVLIQQIAHLCVETPHPQMDLLSAILLYGEGSLEASPQLILQNYILMSDSERGVATIQILAIITAYFTIAKTSLELYASESGDWRDFGTFIRHEETCDDSLMARYGLLGKLWIMLKISPAFLLSLVFKVGSLTIICTMLKGFSSLYILGGAVLAFITAYKVLVTDFTDERLGASLFYSLCNITILSKCPVWNRRYNFLPMMSVSLVWLAYHSLGLITIMIWHGLAPTSSHLSHWTSTHFSSPAILYSCSCSLLVIGPLSILALWALRRTVKGMEDGYRLWDA